jgi:hypothetical protein
MSPRPQDQLAVWLVFLLISTARTQGQCSLATSQASCVMLSDCHWCETGFCAPISQHCPPAPPGKVSGSLKLASDNSYNLTWTVDSKSSSIDLTLSWSGYAWAAIGLHNSPGEGMPDAEVFMCHVSDTSRACESRSTVGGYVEPSVQKNQYLELRSIETKDGKTVASFSRALTVPNSTSSISVPIINKTLGLIYARSSWNAKGIATPS